MHNGVGKTTATALTAGHQGNCGNAVLGPLRYFYPHPMHSANRVRHCDYPLKRSLFSVVSCLTDSQSTLVGNVQRIPIDLLPTKFPLDKCPWTFLMPFQQDVKHSLLSVTGGGKIGERGRLSKPSQLLGAL